jgi:hypothetical protein
MNCNVSFLLSSSLILILAVSASGQSASAPATQPIIDPQAANVCSKGPAEAGTTNAAGPSDSASLRSNSIQLSSTQPTSKDSQEVLLTSGRQAFALRLNQDWTAPWPVWMWTASQCEEMAPRYQGLFLAMDDCKPVLGGTHLLMTSSRGGVVLVKRADNTCAFYAESVNAHSAELVRDRWIVACSSLRGNELQVYSRFDENRPATKLAFVPLAGAHGAVYDWRSEVLWALGTNELLKTKIVEGAGDAPVRIEVLKRFPLPTKGGHDLFPYFHYKQPTGKTPDTAKGLFVTVHEAVYVFDLTSETFEPFAPLADEHDVKSIGDNLRTGQILYTRADGETSFTSSVRFLKPDVVKTLPPKIGVYPTRVYKVRWNQPNPFSYKQDSH